jgi:acyl-CoA hydrolase
MEGITVSASSIVVEIDVGEIDCEGRLVQIANQGDRITCHAAITRTWPTSLEVGIQMSSEDFRTLEHKEILTAYFSFAAVDDDGTSIEIAPIIPETPEQIRRFHDAEERRRYEASLCN